MGDGSYAWLPAAAAALGAILIQIGTNLVNDYADADHGADGPDRLGPARATSKGWLSRSQVVRGAALALGLAAMVGIYIVMKGGWPLLAIGVASVICAIAYTAGPFPLGYKGLGDLFVLIFFGGAAVCGTYYLETGSLSLGAILVSAAMGMLATAILVVNNLRDRKTDVLVGKRTLAVRFGARFARLEYAFMVCGAYGCIIVAVVLDAAPMSWMMVMLSLPLAISELKKIRQTDGAALNPMLGSTARLELIFGLTLSIGALWPW
jgi:1,4-dihydroxy-2-naphthoate octaprenyltransferase